MTAETNAVPAEVTVSLTHLDRMAVAAIAQRHLDASGAPMAVPLVLRLALSLAAQAEACGLVSGFRLAVD